MTGSPRRLSQSGVARRLGRFLEGAKLEPAVGVSLLTSPAWVAAAGVGAARGRYWLWLELEPGSPTGPGAQRAAMEQIVVNAPPGRYLVDMRDAATGATLSRESAAAPPLVLAVPLRGRAVVAEIRPVGAA